MKNKLRLQDTLINLNYTFEKEEGMRSIPEDVFENLSKKGTAVLHTSYKFLTLSSTFNNLFKKETEIKGKKGIKNIGIGSLELFYAFVTFNNMYNFLKVEDVNKKISVINLYSEVIEYIRKTPDIEHLEQMNKIKIIDLTENMNYKDKLKCFEKVALDNLDIVSNERFIENLESYTNKTKENEIKKWFLQEEFNHEKIDSAKSTVKTIIGEVVNPNIDEALKRKKEEIFELIESSNEQAGKILKSNCNNAYSIRCDAYKDEVETIVEEIELLGKKEILEEKGMSTWEKLLSMEKKINKEKKQFVNMNNLLNQETQE